MTDSTHFWQRGLWLAGLLLMWLGFFSPWLGNPAAALRVNGYDLAEWMSFIAEVQQGLVATNRVQHLWPLALLCMLTVLLAWQTGLWGRLALLALAGAGLLSLLPGYPFVLYWREDATVRLMIVTALVAGALCAVSALLLRLPPGPRGWLSALLSGLLALTAVALGVQSRLALEPVVAQWYGHAVPWGYGLWLFLGGGLLLVITAVLALVRPPAGDIAAPTAML